MSKRKLKLIKEFTEFNLQRLNSDSVQSATNVTNPQLSIGDFDRHQDKIRVALSRIGDISKSIHSSSQFKNLKSSILLDNQNLTSLTIQKIIKSNTINYDVYIIFKIDENEYWGVVKNILSNPELISEMFNDPELIKTHEWILKIKGRIIKEIKNWLKPQFGKFKLLINEIQCLSSETGKLLKLPKGSIIEVLKSYDGRIVFKYNSDQYSLLRDNFIYFNWWFEELKSNDVSNG